MANLDDLKNERRFCAYIPDDLYKQVKAYCSMSGLTYSQFMENVFEREIRQKAPALLTDAFKQSDIED